MEIKWQLVRQSVLPTSSTAQCPKILCLAYKGSSPWKEEDRHPIGYDAAGNASIEFEVLFPNVVYNFFHVDIFIYLLSMQVHIGKVTWVTACT